MHIDVKHEFKKSIKKNPPVKQTRTVRWERRAGVERRRRAGEQTIEEHGRREWRVKRQMREDADENRRRAIVEL